MDLSKAFDCLKHELLIAKLSAHGFSPNALLLVHSYLSERKQRVKVNGSFSTWRETMIGVPQGSVLGPLLFNIYLNDLFMFVKDAQICNYADDTTIYACDSNIEGAYKSNLSIGHRETHKSSNFTLISQWCCRILVT